MATIKLEGLTKEQATAICIAFESEYEFEDKFNEFLQKMKVDPITVQSVAYSEDTGNDNIVMFEPIEVEPEENEDNLPEDISDEDEHDPGNL
jgi:hypothetical protein